MFVTTSVVFQMKDIKLDELQLKIMNVLWLKKEATVLEIKEELLGSKELAVTTISTVLSRLEKKDIVNYRKEGKQYVYRPNVAENEVKQSMVTTLVNRLFHGDKASLVNFLVSDTEIDKEELEKLKDKINNLK